MENKISNFATDEKMVISCSGAADVGYISDQVARKLLRNSKCKMGCMAFIATCGEEKIEEFKLKNLLIIDGCSEDCGKKVMQQRGIENYEYLRLTDLGYEKGKTATTQEVVRTVYEKAEAFV